jgi:hypothetical protein
MLLNAAKTSRIIVRKQNRASTWADLNSRGRFGSCAKIRNSNGCDEVGRSSGGRIAAS